MIDKINELPTLPQVTVELINKTFQDEPDIPEIASIIERDSTLTAKLIKTVNSAAFGMRVEVSNIQQTISILGLEALKATIVTIALGEYFINNTFGKTIDVRRYCAHSQATAMIMKESSRFLRCKDDDVLFLIGLLHDLGRLALDTLEGYDYSQVLNLLGQGTSLHEAETQVYGMNSHQIWLEIAKAWGFPKNIARLYQGDLGGEKSYPTLDLVESASHLADRMGFYLVENESAPDSMNANLISGLGEETLLAIGETVDAQMEATRQVLNLPAPDHKLIQRLFLKTTHQLSSTNAELEFRVEVLEELTQVFTGIIKSLDDEALVQSVLETLLEGFKADGVFMLSPGRDSGLQGYAARRNKAGKREITKVRLGRKAFSRTTIDCIKGRKPVKIDHSFEEKELKEVLGDLTVNWLTPIYVKDRFISFLGFGTRNRNSYKFNNPDFSKVVEILSSELGLSLENYKLYSRVRREAVTDPLTKLYNRRMIMKVLATEFDRSRKESTPLSMAIFDMDHFKSLNDIRGHQEGDRFLTRVAEVFRRGVRTGDSMGRYGGDEFIAVLPGIDAQEAQRVVERIRKQLLEVCAGFEMPDLPDKLTVSIGVAAVDSLVSGSDELLRQADAALYQAKELGRNRSVVYEAVGSA